MISLLRRVARWIDLCNERIGELVSWLTLGMVLLQVAVVAMRYVFGIGFVFLQEAIVYMHATVFLAGVGFALLHDGHVRVDIIYDRVGPKARLLVDLAGAVLLLIPVCVFIIWAATPYVAAAWSVLEGSAETGGIPAVFLLKSLILVYALLLLAQGLSLIIKCLLRLLLAGPGGQSDEAVL